MQPSKVLDLAPALHAPPRKILPVICFGTVGNLFLPRWTGGRKLAAKFSAAK
jgi:hypothetical protein